MNGITIAQMSDLHCGSPHFVPSLLERAIAEVNELAPDVVIVSGDLTGDGLRGEYVAAREYLDRVDCERLPGTLAAIGEGADAGAMILRVHDVAEVRDFLTVRAALRGEANVPEELHLEESLRRQRA